ncbi:hypothetical protein MIND_00107300 [Mycena indigotica]|uniref:DUF7918 domain-containing protein n=1 Tax=Mycena indigotica TaxID=2126181 RepID=A0A8H6TFQ3_9AGAR|nr:uncharacterized protein MIND_00107300 [Mycena indigotica]KAF7315907.1 hypothetical protein MIND_00107300 [Mycena indigotica]
MKPFVFASLKSSDDDDLVELAYDNLGTIELKIVPVRDFFQSAIHTPSLDTLQVHERSKKAVTQQITLGDPLTLQAPIPTFKAQRSGPDIVRFVFRYRPLDVLRANGLVPPTNATGLVGDNSVRKRKRKAGPTATTLVGSSSLSNQLPTPDTEGSDGDPSLSESDGGAQDVLELKALKDRMDALEARLASRDRRKKGSKSKKAKLKKEEDVDVKPNLKRDPEPEIIDLTLD